VGTPGDHPLEFIALIKRLTGAVHHGFFGEWFTSSLETYASSSATTRVVHA
jgi:hypothetical protein